MAPSNNDDLSNSSLQTSALRPGESSFTTLRLTFSGLNLLKNILLFALIGFFIGAIPAVSDESPTFPVRFVRPMEEGRIYTIAALAAIHESTTVSWSGSLIEQAKTDFQCELAAAAEVLEVDEDKLPTHVRFRVFWLKKRVTGADEENLLEKNTEVEMFVTSAGSLYQINTEPVSDELHQVLALVMRLPEPANDAIFGSAAERRPGDKWPVNRIEAAGQFLENGLVVQPDDLAAVVNFRDLRDVQGTKCMDIAVEMKAVNAGPELPEGFKLRTGTLEVLISGKMPIDPSQPILEETSEFLLQCEADGRTDGKLLDVKIEVTRTYRGRCIPYGA